MGHVLSLARQHLDMDVAWVGEFAGDDLVFLETSGDAGSFAIEHDTPRPLDETYCRRVVEGSLESVVPDATADPEVRNLAVTEESAIGAYVGVPVRLAGGQIFGVLCCASHEPKPELRDGDARFMGMLADVIAQHLDPETGGVALHKKMVARIRALLDGGGPDMLFQPIVDLASARPVAVEALARFDGDIDLPPEMWFAEAAKVELGVDLERQAVDNALVQLDDLPAGVSLNINCSPSFVLSGALDDVAARTAPRPLVIEITEHASVDDYDDLNEALKGLRAMGVQVAIDDAGAGFASFRHVLELRPEVIKLDRSLTQQVGTDPMRDALTAALTSFAAKAGASVTAEGVESHDCLRALRVLGVQHGQGFLFAAPCRPPIPRIAMPG